MKKIFLFAIGAISLNCAVFAGQEKSVNSKIDNLTVYLRGCQINRTAKFNYSAGTTQIVLQNLSSKIQQNSIQVSGKGDFIIQSVTPKTNYLNGAEKSPREKTLEDSLKMEKQIQEKYTNQQSVYSNQIKLLTANEKIGGNNTGLSVTALKQMMDYFSTTMMDIKTKSSALALKQDDVQKKITRLQKQLKEVTAKNNKPSGEIVVTISAKSAGKGNLKFHYYIADAGWRPSYDIRANDTHSPVSLTYKADIWQNTNVDWKNADITLSTGNPTQAGTQPEINPLYVDFYTYRPYPKKHRRYAAPPSSALSMRGARAANTDAYIDGIKVSGEDEKAESTANYTTQKSNELSTTFHIAQPFSVPSDAKYHTTSIAIHKINSTYNYFAVPKMDKSAFLIANITDWAQYKLLAGNANIFYKDTYVGKSYINPENTDDTLKVSLGRDKNIVITRKKEKDFSKEATIGKQKTSSYKYDITIKNNGSDAINIVVKDQIPISKQRDITVKLLDKGDADYNTNTGILEWKLSLKPSTTSKHSFSYSVAYPKDKTIRYE